MAEFIYTMTKARKALGDKVILDDVTMSFFPCAKIGVVGPNGAGKSTILKIMAGLDQPSNGEARLSPGYTVGILQQEPPLNEEKTVLGNVEEGLGEIKVKLDRFNEIAELMAADYSDELMDEMGKLQEDIDHADAWDLDAQLEQAMDALRCPPPDADVSVLSGGERRRVALCKLLLSKPDLLLLDEPTNHLDAESVQWLEQHLAAYPGAVLASPTTGTSWTTSRSGSPRSTAAGSTRTRATTPPTWRRSRSACRCRARRTSSSPSAWRRSWPGCGRTPRRRQTKSKSRLARYEEMAAEAERTRKLDFDEIQIPPGPRLGTSVIEVENLSKGFGGSPC